MVKSKLIQNLADLYPAMLRKDIVKIIDIIFLEIVNAVKRNRAVEIRSFGRFSALFRNARIARNPKNSNKINIPSKKAVKWKMSKDLFKRLNSNFNEEKTPNTL
jgi:integration host factor subunit beta